MTCTIVMQLKANRYTTTRCLLPFVQLSCRGELYSVERTSTTLTNCLELTQTLM
jgi:hypothetical protein